MTLILGPSSISATTLEEMHRSFREDLAGLRELVREPGGKIREPASLETANELLSSTLAVLELPGHRAPEAMVSEVNLAYATLVAVIDLVKSHSEVPLVPRRRA